MDAAGIDSISSMMDSLPEEEKEIDVDVEGVNLKIHISRTGFNVEGTGEYTIGDRTTMCSIRIILKDVNNYALRIGLPARYIIFITEFKYENGEIDEIDIECVKQMLFEVLDFIRTIRVGVVQTIVTCEKKTLGLFFRDKFLEMRMFLIPSTSGKAIYGFINNIMRFLNPTKYTDPPPKLLVPTFPDSDSDGGGKKNHTNKKYTMKMRKNKKSKKRWSLKYKKSINCKRPRGFSQRQYCKYGRKKS
jgi:hypothetical protein